MHIHKLANKGYGTGPYQEALFGGVWEKTWKGAEMMMKWELVEINFIH